MSVISNLPNWASNQAESFRSNGKLSGAGVNRQSIPPEALGQVEQQLVGEMDKLIQADDSPLDQFPNQKGLVKIDMGGLVATVNYTGDTKIGEMAMDASGAMTTAAYAEFTAEKATIVQVMDMGGQFATIGAHLDRKEPAKSYIETHNMPDGFNLFGS